MRHYFAIPFLFVASSVIGAEPPKESLPDGATVESISITPAEIKLGNPTDYAQTIANATLSTGDVVDVTRLAKLEVAGDVAKVSKTGSVDPLKNGSGELVVTLGDKSARAKILVGGLDKPYVPDYVHDVMPVLSRMGCNAGTCHGSKDGKNGFKLSLRGYDPIYDLRSFTDDLASRRVNVAAPDSSLMLLKATGAVPHEGGQVTKPDSKYYRVVRDWIGNGAKLDLKSPRVTGIEVFPKNPVVQKIGTLQQMRVVATYADGKKRDVTAEAFVESGNTDIATPVKDAVALIQVLRRGEAPVLVRFEGAYAATTVTAMGDRSGFVWKRPPANNKVDELVAAKLKRMKTLSSGLCDDYEFVRRIYLDLTGLPPTLEAIRSFIDDKRDSRRKRDQLIDKLIGSPEYIDYWTNKWADLLQVNGKFLAREGAQKVRDWIRGEIANNTPYDEFCRKVITASGSNKDNPPASYYKILREPANTMENTTHLFLATRFNCNKCHDHPFERWTQDNYYEMAAYFAQFGLKRDDASGKKNIGGTAVEGAKPLYEIVYDKKDGDMKHDRTGEISAPKFPYEAKHEVKEGATRREHLAAWITSPDNRYFATSYVNRVWGYLTGTGIIEPIDDIRAGNPPTNPELLEWLTKKFIDDGFDVRELMRVICKSRTYQLSIETNKWNEDDTINYSHAKARRLPAEVLYDTIYATTGAKSNIPGVPAGTRAAALPDVGVKLPDGFLGNLGRPARESACECERTSDLQLGPVMALISGPTVGNAISDGGNAIAKLVNTEKDDKKLIEELFLRITNRPATTGEVGACVDMMGEIEKEHQAMEAGLAKYLADRDPKIKETEDKRVADIAAAKEAYDKYNEELKPKLAELDKRQKEKTAKLEAELKDYESKIGEKFVAWETSNKNRAWATTEPVEFSATNNAKLEKQDDQSIYVSGSQGKGDYKVVMHTDLTNITAIKLETLTDKRLPGTGPGRSGANGNFVLTEFEVMQAPKSDPGKTVKVALQNAKADFSQKNFEVGKAIDGKVDRAGWAISPQEKKPHTALFETKDNLGHEGGTMLTFYLKHHYDDTHAIGRFRISLTRAPRPVNLGLPENIEKLLAIAPDKREQKQKDELLKYFRDNDGELKRRQNAVAESKKPRPEDPKLKELREKHAKLVAMPAIDSKRKALEHDLELSKKQLAQHRLTAAQDIAWALINTPAFLFNH